MRQLFALLFVGLFIPALAWSADALCEQRIDQARNSKACTVSSAKNFSGIAELVTYQKVQECEQEYKKNKCDELAKNLSKEDQSKIAVCDGKHLCRTLLEKNLRVGIGCAMGGKNFVVGAVDSVLGLAKMISESHAEEVECSTGKDSLQTKTLLFALYNDSVPKALQRKIPPQDALERMRCNQIRSTLFDAHGFSVKKLDAEYEVAMKTKRPISPELAEFHQWQLAQMNKAPGVQSHLLESAKKLLEETGIKLSCYNEAAATAMLCEAVITGAVTFLPGSAALTASRLRLLKLAGLAEKETALAGGALNLQKVAALSNSERIVSAEKLLGRPLSEAQKKALIDAHEVGAGTGRGISSEVGANGTRSTYSATDLREKADILKNSGFSQAERDLLMREGLAGSLSDTQAAQIYANKARLEADKLRVSGKIKESEATYRGAADSYDAYLKDSRMPKSDRDFAVGAELNARAGRYDKAAEYFIKSKNSAGNADERAQALFESLRRERDELRSIAARNSGAAGTEKAYQDHLKLIEAVVKSPNFRMGEAWKRELLKP